MLERTVTLYSTSDSPYCAEEKAWLNSQDIPFKECLVDDEEKQNEMIKKSGQMNVPVTIISDEVAEQIVIGFDKNELARLLGLGDKTR
jgi:glutaredoxin